MFYIGQKVVCVKKGTWVLEDGSPDHDPDLPKFGDVLTISAIYSFKMRTVLFLNGHVSRSFDAVWFRPIVDRKTDISIFEAMLKPSKVPEPA